MFGGCFVRRMFGITGKFAVDGITRLADVESEVAIVVAVGVVGVGILSVGVEGKDIG